MWNSIVEVRARNDKNKDDDVKEHFGTKERSFLEPFEQKKVAFKDSFRNKEGNVDVKIWDT